MMKKLFALMFLCGSQAIFADGKQFVYADLSAVLEKAQITADIRREAESSQEKLQSEYQKLSKFCLDAEKELNSALELAVKNGSSMDSLEIKKIDVTTKRDTRKCELEADQRKLQVTFGGKIKACEERVARWAKEFGQKNNYASIHDAKLALFVSPDLDVTSKLTQYCDDQYRAEKKTGELLAANIKNIDLSKKSTVLAENASDKSSKEAVTA